MELTGSFFANKIFSRSTNEKQKARKCSKKQFLGRTAGHIIYVLMAKNLMYYSEIALSALHFVKSDNAAK